MEGYHPRMDIRTHVMHCEDRTVPEARIIVSYITEVLGTAIRNIYLAEDPDYIVLQGTFADCTDGFLRELEEKARENRYLEDMQIDIRRSQRTLEELQKIGGVNTLLCTLANRELKI